MRNNNRIVYHNKIINWSKFALGSNIVSLLSLTIWIIQDTFLPTHAFYRIHQIFAIIIIGNQHWEKWFVGHCFIDYLFLSALLWLNIFHSVFYFTYFCVQKYKKKRYMQISTFLFCEYLRIKHQHIRKTQMFYRLSNDYIICC